MSTISKPNTFSPNTTISSSAVNANFDTIYNDYNGSISAANLAANAISTAKIADSAVTTAKINDAAVTNAKLSLGAATWTPTITNLSGGTINYARYTQIGKRVFCEFKYTLAGANMGTAPTLTLPVAPATHYTDNDIIDHFVLLSETGAQDYYGLARISQTDDLITLYVQRSNGTYVDTANITSAIPFTWGSTDIVRAAWNYEAA